MMPLARRPATKVVVRQWPQGAAASRRSPRGQRPSRLAMLVVAPSRPGTRTSVFLCTSGGISSLCCHSQRDAHGTRADRPGAPALLVDPPTLIPASRPLISPAAEPWRQSCAQSFPGCEFTPATWCSGLITRIGPAPPGLHPTSTTSPAWLRTGPAFACSSRRGRRPLPFPSGCPAAHGWRAGVCGPTGAPGLVPEAR